MGNVTTTDDYSPALTAGGHAHATTSGDYARATTSGVLAHAATTGDFARATTSGENSIAAAFGANSAARAANGGFIVLAQYNPDGDTVVAIKTAQAGRDGIKPDTWYKLSPTGEFVEAEVE